MYRIKSGDGVVLITGGSSGIGKGLVDKFRADGYTVDKEMRMYKAIGDAKVVLFESDYLFETVDWIRGYVRWGDFGGYEAIEAISYEDDETIVHQSFFADAMVA